ncbi:MAG: hypothetical protein ACPG49_06730, partial [Chitinophagales bacterium]
TELQKGEITTFCEELFPVWMRGDNFTRSRAIRQRFKELYDLIQDELTQQEKEDLCQAFFDSNEIEKICGDINYKVTSITDLPKKIQELFINKRERKGLFVWLYDYILTGKDSPIPKILKADIKAHYKKYQRKNPAMCPFCGLEYISLLNSEGREGYDHYLHKTHYSFSAVNMKNLIPMGIKCNKKKTNDDILLDKKNNRVEVFYPFSFKKNKKYGVDFYFTLSCKKYPNIENIQGEWKIELCQSINNNQLKSQLETWKRRFNINNRYSEYIQVQHFRWLKELFTDVDFSKKDNIDKAKVLEKLNTQFGISEPNETTLENYTGLIPRYLYFKFLKDDEVFAKTLISLFVEEKSKRRDDDNDLEL